MIVQWNSDLLVLVKVPSEVLVLGVADWFRSSSGLHVRRCATT
jgi:hypothetical protein